MASRRRHGSRYRAVPCRLDLTPGRCERESSRRRHKGRLDAHAYEVAPQKILGLVDFGARGGMYSKRGSWVHMACRGANHGIDARRPQRAPPKYSLALCSCFDCIRRRYVSSSGKLRWHPSGTVRATPAVIRFSRSINPICTASLTNPPSELKRIGRSRFAKTAKNSQNRWAAPSSNLPSPAIHSVQPRPQAFGSPVAITKISPG
jgi:hypothetical protein